MTCWANKLSYYITVFLSHFQDKIMLSDKQLFRILDLTVPDFSQWFKTHLSVYGFGFQLSYLAAQYKINVGLHYIESTNIKHKNNYYKWHFSNTV